MVSWEPLAQLLMAARRASWGQESKKSLDVQEDEMAKGWEIVPLRFQPVPLRLLY